MARGAKVVITAEDKTRAALDSASGGFGKLQAHASSMSTGMGLAMAGAGAAVLAFAKSSIDKYEQVGTETIKLSRLTGGTAQDMSALRVEAQMSGVPFDQLAKSITIFAKGLENGKPAKAMADLGIATHDATGATRPFGEMLGQLSDKFHDMPNGLDKTRLATELFGRSGADLEPLLNKGSGALAEITAKAKDLGLILDGNATKAMAEHIKKQREMTLAMDGMKMSLGEALIPVMEKGVSVVTTMAEGFAKLPGPVKDIAVYGAAAAGGMSLLVSGLKFGAGIIGNVKTGLQTLKGALTDAEGSMTSLGSSGAALGAAGIGGALLYMQAQAEAAKVSVNGLDAAVKGLANPTSIESVTKLNAELSAGGAAQMGWGTAAIASLPGIGMFASDTLMASNAQSQINAEIAKNPAHAEKMIDALIRSGKSTGLLGDSLGELKKAAHDAATGQKAQTDATDASTAATDAATLSLDKYESALKAATDPIFAVMDAQSKQADSSLAVFAAQLDVNNAVRMFGEGSPAAVAAHAALDKASQDSVLAAQSMDGAVANLSAKIKDHTVNVDQAKNAIQRYGEESHVPQAELDKIKTKFDAAGQAARNAAGNYELTVTGRTSGITGPTGIITQIQNAMKGISTNIPGHAAGGPVPAGQLSVVGERGPELFMPSTNGTIIPNNALGGVGSGTTFVVNVTAGVGNPQEIGATIVDMVRQYERTNGTSWRN